MPCHSLTADRRRVGFKVSMASTIRPPSAPWYRECQGFTIHGQPALASIEMAADGSVSAMISRQSGCTWTAVATKFDCGTVYRAALWLSKQLDGGPLEFGEINLRHLKAQSALFSDGAEHYVAGYLMLQFGLFVSRVSRSHPGFDLIVRSPSSQKSCTVQVKYRSGSRSSVCTSNQDFDFLVLISMASAMERFRRSRHHEETIQMWVIPGSEVLGLGTNPRYDEFCGNWTPLLDRIDHHGVLC